MIAEQLKKSILQAAIQGELTEQLPEDGDARDLFKEIKKEKARLNKVGKIKNENPFSEITEDESPFDIPDNWCWCKFGDIAINRDAERKPVSKALRENLKKEYDYYGASGIIDKIDNFIFSEELLLIGEDGANLINRSTPIAFIASGKYWVNNHAHVLQMPLNLNIEYMCFFINAISLTQYVTGTAQPKMNQQKMNSIPVSVPPPAEQKRIVEHLNKVLPEIDKLKNDESKLDVLQKFFPKKMKDSILQYAIQGKLTEQLPEDGDAKDLLKEIQKEKARLVKEGKLRKEKPLPEITADEVPFDIPENWCWVRLGNVTEITMGQSPEGNTVGIVNGIEFHQGKIHFTEKEINDSGQRCTEPKKIAHADSVLLCVRAPVGDSNTTNREICIGRGLAAINGFGKILNEYFYYYLITVKKYFIDNSTGSTFKAINQDIIKASLMPLPPLSEQQRILDRLSQILPLCNIL